MSSNCAPQRPRLPTCNRSLRLRWNARPSPRKFSMSSPCRAPTYNRFSTPRRLLGGQTALVMRVVGGMLHLAPCTAGSRASHEEIRASFPTPLTSSGIHSRAAMSSSMTFRSDIETEPGVSQAVKEMARVRGYPLALPIAQLQNTICCRARAFSTPERATEFRSAANASYRIREFCN